MLCGQLQLPVVKKQPLDGEAANIVSVFKTGMLERSEKRETGML